MLDLCKKNNVKTCSIVNVIESTIARNSDWVLPIHAGPEIGVASTKAFTTQLVSLALMLCSIGKLKNVIDKSQEKEIVVGLKKLPGLMKGLGKGIKDFKDAKNDIRNETEDKDEK